MKPEDLKPTEIQLTMTSIGRLFGKNIWIETNDEQKIKLAKQFLNDKIDEAELLRLKN